MQLRSSTYIAESAKSLYEGVPGTVLQTLRPWICPFDALIASVPVDSDVLDVGCGAGLFVGLLANAGVLRSGLGFDLSVSSIAKANLMKERHPLGSRMKFQCLDVAAKWPDIHFDVVSMIDVMHHVYPTQQKSLIATAVTRLKPGGLFLYKDMARLPAWKAWINRLHDLVLARQWIHYADIAQVEIWLTELGLTKTCEGQFDLLWYRHEMLIFKKAN